MANLLLLIAFLAAQSLNGRSVTSEPELKLRWKGQPRLTYCSTDGGVSGAIRVAEIVFENTAKHPLLLLRQPAEFHGFVMRPINPSLSGNKPYEYLCHSRPSDEARFCRLQENRFHPFAAQRTAHRALVCRRSLQATRKQFRNTISCGRRLLAVLQGIDLA